MNSLTGWRRDGAIALGCAIAGAVAAQGQAPTSLVAALFVGLGAGLWAVGRAGSPVWAGLRAWAMGTGYFLVLLRWLTEPFQVDAAAHAWMAPFALAGMAAGLALFWGVAGWWAARVGPTPGVRALTMALALTLAEMARATLFSGFPWGLIGYGLETTPAVHAAAVVGPHGLTLLLLVLVCAPAAGRAGVLIGGAGLAALALALAFGMSRPANVPDTGKVVRIVQPNAPQVLKWDPAHAPGFFAGALAATAAEAAARPDLVIWPETAITPWLADAQSAFDRISQAAGGAEVILGLRRYEGRRIFNALVLLGPDGRQADLYDKARLVPFGEYVPFGGVLGRLGLRGLAAADGNGFSPGGGARLIATSAGRFRPLICYEAIFPSLARQPRGDRPDFVVQITNDAWFGNGAGPAQHLAQARMRAVETGLPVLRAANTGISAAIGADGTIKAALPLGDGGHVDAAIPGALPPTPYWRWGDWPVLVLLLCGLAAVSLRSRRKI